MGCDWIQLRQCNRTPRFNPRTHMGCDSIRTRRAGLNTWFQSTHPHGMRHLLPEEIRGLYRFNPRTHMGCDPGSGQLLSVRRCFNPRTHMGCDAAYLCYLNGLSCFNPRTHMGCDHFTELGLSTCPEFQSTHPHGMRLYIVCCHSNYFCFNHFSRNFTFLKTKLPFILQILFWFLWPHKLVFYL